jgi:ribonucleoside-diphosphate reductase alpha chain
VAQRSRLPNRRRAETWDLPLGNMPLSATVCFDETGRPAEIFLSGAKDGSGMAATLEDASVVISVALQHGIPASALSKSIRDRRGARRPRSRAGQRRAGGAP